jgi:putative Holliday junction resolvase
MSCSGSPAGRIIGVDLGDRRIGLSVSDPGALIALGLETLENRGEKHVIEHFKRLAAEYSPRLVVVGYPLNMDGSRGPRAEQAEKFADKLKAELGVEVALWDERLSTFAAEEALSCGGVARGKKKKHVDRVSAQLILQGYLDSNFGRKNENS